MIIVSQDKRMVINFNNIVGIVIRKNTQENIFQVQCKSENEKNARILGKYATEERAKEVLQSIVATYQADKMFECAETEEQNQMAERYIETETAPFKFEMPEDEEEQ